MDENVRDTMLEVIEASLEAQLNAVRRLRKSVTTKPSAKERRGRSHMDMAYDVLISAGEPLHLREIVRRIGERFGVHVDSDSLGSALTTRVVKEQRFSRPAKNTFAILEEKDAG
jgi:hypothetical protein